MTHHVGMIWMIENNEDLKYDMELQNSDFMKGGRLYNTFICKKLHRKLFDQFIIYARTDTFNIMCY